MKSASELLGEELHQAEASAVTFLRDLPVTRSLADRYDGLVVVAPDYWWSSPEPRQLRQQMAVRENILRLHERLLVLLSTAAPQVQRKLAEGKDAILRWIDLDLNWSLSPDPDENEEQFRQAFRPLHECVEILQEENEGRIIIVPDTNAIAGQPDPRKYRVVADQQDLVFVLLPTVIAELDRLKIEARNEGFRKKVSSAIRRIKGWRNQGSLLSGITVDKTIEVVAVPYEPDFSATLSWLDRENNDDRIIASILEVQRRHPSALLVLVTSDVNLQNKAEAAGIPWAEVPKGS